MPRPMTKTQRIARERLTYHLWMLDRHTLDPVTLRDDFPEEWHTIEADVDVEEPKEKVTLYLDRSVARLFKGMGKGYQNRINRILATWMHMRAMGLLETERYLGERLTNRVYSRTEEEGSEGA